MIWNKKLIIWTQWMQKVGLTTRWYALKTIINKLKPMVQPKMLKLKQFNFDNNDRVRVFNTSRMYGKNSFHPENMEGTIVAIKENSDSESADCPLYIVWDNGTFSANALKNIELIDAERLKHRFTYDPEKLSFKDAIPKTLDEVLPLLYSNTYRSAIETYYKNDFGMRIHCQKNKLRSFDDIYYLFKAYFPEETYASVFKRMLLYKVTLKQIETNNLAFQLSECSTIKRIRYIPFGSNSSIKSIWSEAENARKYESITHWRDLFKLINVNSSEELTKWYMKELQLLVITPEPKKS